MNLRHKAPQAAVLDYSCTIVKPAPDSYRHADHNCNLSAPRECLDFLYSFFSLPDQNLLPEQVGAGVSGHGKLRECNKRNFLILSLFRQFENLSDIVCDICHPDRRNAGSNPEKTVIFHRIYSDSMSFSNNADILSAAALAAITTSSPSFL